MRFRALAAVLLLGLTLSVEALVGQPAGATHPDPVELAITDLLSFRTAYFPAMDGVVQVDTKEEIATWDVWDTRVYWDGDALWIHRRYGPVPNQRPDPVELPAEWAARVRQVWKEYRLGFPNTTFVREDPTVIDPDARGIEAAHPHYRVKLPFAWDDGYAIYVTVSGIGTPGRLAVYDLATSEIVTLGKSRKGNVRRLNVVLPHDPSELDVPLSPETYAPDLPEFDVVPFVPKAYRSRSRLDSYKPTWHETRQRIRFTALPTNDDLTQPGSRVTSSCPTAPSTTIQNFSVGFEFPDDPKLADLAQLAIADCPNGRFEMAVAGWHFAEPGQRTCLSGQWQVVDTLPDPDVVLWQDQVAMCRNGPTEDRLVYPTRRPITAGFDPTGLEVRFRGLARIDCLQVGSPDKPGYASFIFPEEDQPVLRWLGCYPGWTP